MLLFNVLVTVGTGNPYSGKKMLIGEQCNTYDLFYVLNDERLESDLGNATEAVRRIIQSEIDNAHAGLTGVSTVPFWNDVRLYGGSISCIKRATVLMIPSTVVAFFDYKPLFKDQKKK